MVETATATKTATATETTIETLAESATENMIPKQNFYIALLLDRQFE